MARKQSTVRIADEGRDQGKVFLLTELSAMRAEKWAARALFALAKGDVELPENFAGLGMAELARLGIDALAHVPWELAEPLFDEMWSCVVLIPDPSKPIVTRALIEDDIEEVKTRIQLRKEVLNLHLDFFTRAGR